MTPPAADRSTATDEIRVTLERLRSGGSSVLDQGIRWRPANWKAQRQLAPLRSELEQVEQLSEPLSDDDGWRLIRRRHVFNLAEHDVTLLFLASQVWGHGSNGYGPYRVGRVVEHAGARLTSKLEAQRDAALTGATAAWDAIRGSTRLTWLGPAFATKFHYFSSFERAGSNPAPLIADLNTSWALWELAGVPRSVEQRSSYLRYIELANEWAEANNWRADEVEWALFDIGRTVERR